jgi:hypothetical protein
MALQDSNAFQMIEMAVFSSTSLTGSFQVINGAAQQPIGGATGFGSAIKILQIYNDSNNGVTFSLDGLTGHFYLPSKGTEIIDLQTNHADISGYASGTLNGRQGQLIWAQGTAGSAGLNIYIMGYR